MKMQLALIVVACLGFSAVAHADDWSLTAEFAGAQSASIRVVEPEGYTVTINGRTDTVPAVFAVDNAANYFTLSIKSPDGASWAKKVEVKEYKQTVVHVKHVKADPPPANSNKPIAYVGTLINTSNNCAGAAATIKLEFIAGADVAKSSVLEAGAHSSVELPVGSYKIRLWVSEGQQWSFKETVDYDVKKDGWVYEWGCTAVKRR